jgi:hypothetical protein
LKAIIDRLEGDKAVLIMDADGQALIWPRSELPEGSSEGDCLVISVGKDIAGTEKRRAESQDIIDRLTGQKQAEEEDKAQ